MLRTTRPAPIRATPRDDEMLIKVPAAGHVVGKSALTITGAEDPS